MDTLFLEAFSLWNSPVTWLELAAVALSLAMVVCNIREIHWGWPLAFVSSLMYLALFWRSKLYGEAGLQVLFAVLALWGWVQWLAGKRPDGSLLRPVRLPPRGRIALAAAGAALWLLTGWFLDTVTDSDVPWWDAFPTAFSVIGQVLLARKYLENWVLWLGVNVASVALFAYKALWLTAGLYVLFAVLSVLGWRAWRARL